MRVAVSIPFSDTRAADLAWSVTHGPIEPLVSRTVALGDVRVHLCVLGASHQVVGEHGAIQFVETVACLPDVSGGLPAEASPQVPGIARYHFTSSVHHLERAEFTARTTALRDRLAECPGALLAVFPGNPLAITALFVARAGPILHWYTWHAYPQTGELVTTVSTAHLHPSLTGRENPGHGH